MASWLDKPGSLNWANKKKLSQEINLLEKTISQLKENLSILLSFATLLEIHCNQLSELKKEHRLTAKHIIHLRPILEETEFLHNTIHSLCQVSSSDENKTEGNYSAQD